MVSDARYRLATVGQANRQPRRGERERIVHDDQPALGKHSLP